MAESKNWQVKATTVQERNEFMFNNELISDVHFLVGKDKLRIPAHKYVLAISSPVFLAMFYGRLAGHESDVSIGDGDVESFMELLRFIYTDKVVLTLDNALEVLYLAKKYIVPALVRKCIDYVERNLNHDNVLTVLCHSRFLAEEDLVKKCWSVVDLYTTQVFDCEGFSELDEETLTLLVQRNTLTASEVSLFNAVKLWAEQECARRDVAPTAENKRIVAKGPMKYIRFPLMAPVEFADEVARSGLLTHEEITNIFLFFLSSFETKLPFSDRPRIPQARTSSKALRLSRFQTCCGKDWFCDTRKCDQVMLMADRPVHIKGIAVYGASKVEGEYKVNLELLEESKVLSHTKTAYSSTTQSVTHDIYFDQSVLLKKNVVYTISVLLQGPCSVSGTDGVRDVVAEGVKFSFLEHTSPNGSSLSAGQIPEIIFHP